MIEIFFDRNTGFKETKTSLLNRGLEDNINLWKTLNIYPIKLVQPDTYDSITEYLEPIGDLVFNEEEQVYEQNFKVSPLDDEILSVKLLELIENKRKECQNMADSASKQYTDNFSSLEKLTWTKQQEEINTYLKDPVNAETPTIDKIASIRGIDREVLIDKIKNKLELFNNYALNIIGLQQKYEDQIKEINNDSSKSLKEKIHSIYNLVFDFNINNN